MAASFRDGTVVGLCLMAMVVVGSIGVEAQLSTDLTIDFYDDKCPQIYDIVKAEVQKAVAAETRMAASLVRLHFHDCFVNGCDGSILLNSTNGTGTDNSEKTAPPNNNSARGFPVIDAIKAKLEAACPQTVSCADILAIASRDSAVEAGLTPGYPVFFGRRDSLNFSQADATQFLPSPFMEYSNLTENFKNVGLDEVDLVALSGAHTIGRVNCTIILNPQLNSSFDETYGFDPAFHQSNIDTCNLPGKNTSLLNLDHITPDFFDNWYYKNLLKGEGAIGSDQTLFSTPGVIGQELVAKFAFDPAAFAAQFVLSTIKMGNIKPLTGTEGEIRLNCAVANNATSPNATLTSPSGSAASLVASQ